MGEVMIESADPLELLAQIRDQLRETRTDIIGIVDKTGRLQRRREQLERELEAACETIRLLAERVMPDGWYLTRLQEHERVLKEKS